MSERAEHIYSIFEAGIEEGKTGWTKLDREIRDRFAVLGNVTLSEKARQDMDAYEVEIYEMDTAEASQFGEMKENIIDHVVAIEERKGQEFGDRAIIAQLRNAMNELYPSEKQSIFEGQKR